MGSLNSLWLLTKRLYYYLWEAMRKQNYPMVCQSLPGSRKRHTTCCSGGFGSSEKGRGWPKVTQPGSFPCSNKIFFPQFCVNCQTGGHPQRRRTRAQSQSLHLSHRTLCVTEAPGNCNSPHPSLKWGGPLLKKISWNALLYAHANFNFKKTLFPRINNPMFV